MPKIFTIHASFGFADTLAQKLITIAKETAEKKGEDWQQALSRMTLFLPNHRSVGIIKSALWQNATIENQGGILLPKIFSLGDIANHDVLQNITEEFDEGVLGDSLGELADGLEDGVLGDSLGELGDEVFHAHAVLPTAQRLFFLMRLIDRFYQGADFLRHMSPDALLALAKKLAGFLDQLTIAEVDSRKLLEKNIFEDEKIFATGDITQDEKKFLAQHWQQIFRFLSIIIPTYKDFLLEEKKYDQQDIINRTANQLIEFYQRRQPSEPIIIAGSTGSRPAIRRLMACVMNLPQGMVILPNFDSTMPDDIWRFLHNAMGHLYGDEKKLPDFLLSALVHPQRTMVGLLYHLKLDKKNVLELNSQDIYPAIKARQELLRSLFLPPTNHWRQVTYDNLPLAIKGIVPLTLPDQRAEAKMAALIIKKNLLENKKTISVVSLDKQLNRQLLLELSALGIETEDSSGTPFWQSALGIFLFTAVNFFSNPDLVPCYYLLSHPYVVGEKKLEEARKKASGVITHLLPLMRKTSFAEIMWGDKEKDFNKSLSSQEQENFLWLKEILAPMKDFLTEEPQSPHHWLQGFIKFINHLTHALKEDIWAGPAGNKWRQLVEVFMPNDATLTLPRRDFADWLYELLIDENLHKPFLSFPSLKILGPLEARLLKSDVTILMGLVEGVWPRVNIADPWLPESLRQAWHLMDYKERLSLSAQDFSLHFLSPELFLLSRSQESGVVLEQSRWLQRLSALLKVAEEKEEASTALADMEAEKNKWLALLKQYQQTTTTPTNHSAPSPKPPLTTRPKQLSVTQIEKWRANPFWIYANKILRLTKPDDIDTDDHARQYGNLLHELLKEFILQKNNHQEKENIFLYELADQKIADHFLFKDSIFWKRLIYNDIDFFWKNYQSLPIAKTWVEIKGAIELKSFTMTARADRIDLLKDNQGVNIVDYKTGGIPSQIARQKGESLQLPLEAIIAKGGGFSDSKGQLNNKLLYHLQFWQLNSDKSKIEDFDQSNKKEKKDNEELIESAMAIITAMVNNFADADYGFTATPDKLRYNDYDLLALEGLWSDQMKGEDNDE